MYICICNAVTESDIREAVDDGVRNLKQLTQMTGCISGCGCCKETAVQSLKQALAEGREEQVLLPVMQLA